MRPIDNSGLRPATAAGTYVRARLWRRRIHRTNQSYHWQGKKALLFKALKSSIDRKRAAGDEGA